MVRSILVLAMLCALAGPTMVVADDGASQSPHFESDSHCTLCGFLANTVEAFLLENNTHTDISTFIEKDLCSHLDGKLKAVCDTLSGLVPEMADSLVNHHKPGAVCQKLGFCDHPARTRADPVPLTGIHRGTINLDLAPEQRWDVVMAPYRPTFQEIKALLYKLFPGHLSRLDPVGEFVVNHLPEPYPSEIKGIAKALNVTVGLLGLANLGYELTDLCTSIVTQDENGAITHARNLDFGVGMGFTDLLRNMTLHLDFQQGNKTVYSGVTYAGFVGLLTGMRPGGFAITVNTRFYQGPIWDMFSEIVAAITLKGAAINSMVLRDTLGNVDNFADAKHELSTRPLLANVYFTVSGVGPGEGCVLTRNQTVAENTWCLDASNGTWYVVETNYDNWKPAPWYDDRRHPAESLLSAMTPGGVTEDALLGVLGTRPVLNQMTTYSIVASAKLGKLDAWSRYCNEPCPE